MLETSSANWEKSVFEKGFKKGLEKGLEIVVLKLLSQGLPVLSIRSLTSLSSHKINLLKGKCLAVKMK